MLICCRGCREDIQTSEEQPIQCSQCHFYYHFPGCCERFKAGGIPKLFLGDRFLRFICDRCCDTGDEKNGSEVRSQSQLLRLQVELAEGIAILLKNASSPQTIGKLKSSLRRHWSRFYPGKPDRSIIDEKLEATLQLYEEIYFTRADDDAEGHGAWRLVSEQILAADLQARPVSFDMAVTETSSSKPKKPAAKKPVSIVDTGVDADAELESLGLKPSKGLRKKMQRLAATTVFSNLDFDRPNPLGQPLVLSRAPTHTAQQMVIQADSLTVSNANGFAMARATHGFEFGSWYFEVEILQSPQAAHIRLGVAQILAEAQAPVGFDEYGYGYRDRDGRLLHCGRSEAYGEPFGPGDVIGVTMVLPASPSDVTTDDTTRIEREARFPPKRLGAYKVRQEILAGGHCHFQFSVNGRPQGRAFPDPYRAKYYPAVSLYGGAACKLNFGPDFRHPCPPGAKPAYLIQDEEEAHGDGNGNQQ